MFELKLPDGATYRGDSRPAAKAWDGETVKGVVVKADDERRYTLTVAYPADSADIGRARDGFQDFASKDAVENAAWSYMEKARNVGLMHAEGTDGAGTVVESYVYRGPDWPLEAADGTGQVIKAGDWLIGIRWGEDAWNMIKSGEIGGVSMQGAAVRRTPSPADVARVKGSARANR
jgi:putative serine protease XkdF